MDTSINTRKIKILAFYRGKILENRGTPIRVRSLLTRIEEYGDVELSVFSWDEETNVFSRHVYLDNNHWKDVKKITRYVKENNIDVIWGHTIASAYYLLPLRFLTRAKIVLEVHGFMEEEAYEYGEIGYLKYLLMKTMIAVFYVVCDLIITCSYTATEIIKKYNKNAVSVYGGVDTKFFRPKIPSGNYFKKDSRIVIGYAGNARKWQGLNFLVDTYQKLPKDKFRLVLLLSERKGVSPDLEIYGPVSNEEVPKFLVDCDILIIPRPLTTVTRISYPSKLTEYLAMGKVVVSSNVGDADKVITHGVNGFLYTPGNQGELIELLLLLQDKSLRDKLGRAAAKTAQGMSWNNQAKALLENIKKIV